MAPSRSVFLGQNGYLISKPAAAYSLYSVHACRINLASVNRGQVTVVTILTAVRGSALTRLIWAAGTSDCHGWPPSPGEMQLPTGIAQTTAPAEKLLWPTY